MFLIGVLLLLVGVLYAVKTPNEEPKKEEEIVQPIYGKYANSNYELGIYEFDSYVYLVIPNVIYGKGRIDNNQMNFNYNNYYYKLTFGNGVITINSNDERVNGVYNRKTDLTYDAFYEFGYGNIDYFDTQYNGVYNNDNFEIVMYQSSESEVLGFITTTEKEKKLVHFKIKDDNTLVGTYNDEKYTIQKYEYYIILINGDSELPNETNSIKLDWEGLIIRSDAFNLLNNYQ